MPTLLYLFEFLNAYDFSSDGGAEIQEENNIDLTGPNQHGFKKKHSTASLSLTIQSIITKALEEEEYAAMANILPVPNFYEIDTRVCGNL